MSVSILATDNVGRHCQPTMTGHVARLRKPQNGKSGRDTDTEYKTRLPFNRRRTTHEQHTQTRSSAPVTLTLTRWPWFMNVT